MRLTLNLILLNYAISLGALTSPVILKAFGIELSEVTIAKIVLYWIASFTLALITADH